MALAFAAKLRMAAAALGCASRKEFCAHFREVNPATQCDLDRLNKWMQGRSLPRVSSVYADFAAVIGTAQPGRWVAESSLDEFIAELAARTGAEAASLALVDPPSPRGGSRGVSVFGGVATLSGAYAAYSPAWSPHFRGRLVRGSLRLVAGRNGALIATYTESLVGRDVRLSAPAWIDGRSMHLAVREEGADAAVFISVQVPGPPASVLCGVMSGAAFVAHESLPSTSRIVFIRVPETSRLDASNRYIEPTEGVVVADLAALGLATPDADRLDAMVRAFLGMGADQVTAQDQTAFAGMLDGEHFRMAG